MEQYYNLYVPQISKLMPYVSSLLKLDGHYVAKMLFLIDL